MRNPYRDQDSYGKYVAVNETRDRGWWIPGGAVDFNENFVEAAIRECKEEAGIDVALKGVLRVDHGPVRGNQTRMRVIFYGEPTTPEQAQSLKRVADKESLEARWVDLEECAALQGDGAGLRGDELLVWGNYLNSGGHVYPLSMFGSEGGTQTVENSRSMTIEELDKLREENTSSQ